MLFTDVASIDFYVLCFVHRKHSVFIVLCVGIKAIVPAYELIQRLGCFRKYDLIAYCVVSRIDERAALHVELNCIGRDAERSRVGLTVCRSRDRERVCACLRECNISRGVGRGCYSRAVERYRVLACTKDCVPAKDTVFVCKVFSRKGLVRNGKRVAPSRRVTECSNRYVILACCKTRNRAKIQGKGVRRLRDIAYLNLVAACACYCVPAQYVAFNDYVRGRCKNLLCVGVGCCFGRVVAPCLGRNRNQNVTCELFEVDASLVYRKGLRAVALNRDFVCRCFLDCVPAKDLRFLVHCKARSGVEVRRVDEGSGYGICVAVLASRDNKGNTLFSHLAVSKIIRVGIAVVDDVMLVRAVTAGNRNVICVCINVIEGKEGILYREQ